MDDVKDSGTAGTQRRYHSPLRDENARETRARIIDAAAELFLERGFARVSVDEIARASGVARPTVLTVFGTKANLLRAVVDVAMAGNDGPVPVAQQPWFRPVWDATTGADCLTAYAKVCVLIGRRSADVIELVRRASDEGDDIAAQWESLQANRRFGAGTIAQRVHDLGDLRAGLTVRRATDLVRVWNDTHHYRTLVTESGWSERAFQHWLAEQMRSSLLDEATDSRRQ